MEVLLATGTPPAMRAAAARCLCAVLASSRSAQYPLTEETMFAAVLQWCDGRGHAAATAPHGSALRAYAMGLLAVALTSDDLAAFAVREGIMARLMRDLRTTLLGGSGGSAAGRAAGPVGGGSADASACETAESATAICARLRTERVRAVASIGDYVDCFGAALAEGALEVALHLLAHAVDGDGVATRRRAGTLLDSAAAAQLAESLQLACSLLAHRRFAVLFVSSGGLALLLALPVAHPAVAPGVARALYNMACATPALECAAALPGVPRDVCALALLLLESGLETARRHAALFLSLALPIRPFLRAFDDGGGLRPLVNMLRSAAHLRAGQSSAAKSAACVACHALRQYLRAHFTFHVHDLRRVIAEAAAAAAAAAGPSAVTATPAAAGKARSERPPRPHALSADLSNATVERLIAAVRREKRLGTAFLRSSWPALDAVMAQDGVAVLLKLALAGMNDRHLSDSLQDTLVRDARLCQHCDGR
jgi:HIV-1 Vpr-binding protein